MSAPKQRLRQSIPDPRSRNVEGPTTDYRQSEPWHHQVTGAGRSECPPTVQICYSVKWSKVPWRCVVQNLVREYGDLVLDDSVVTRALFCKDTLVLRPNLYVCLSEGD